MEAKLIVVRGKANKAEVVLSLPSTIGRSRDADLTVAHPMVSRHHCEIYESDGKLKVRDLGSLNGTFINGERISDAELPASAEMTVGPLTFRAEYGEAREAEELPMFEDAPAEGEVAFEDAEKQPETGDETRPAESEEIAPAGKGEVDFSAFEEVAEEGAEPKASAKAEEEAAEAEETEEKAEEKAEEEAIEEEAIEEEAIEEEAEPEPPPKKKAAAAKKPAKKEEEDLVEMEDLEETAAFTVKPAEDEADTTVGMAKDDEEEEAGEEEEAEEEDEDAEAESKPKKGWWPFKKGEGKAKKAPSKAEAAKKESPKKETPKKEAAKKESPKKAEEPAAKKEAKPAAPAKKAAAKRAPEPDFDDVALAAVQGEDDGGADGKSITESEEDDLDDFLKGLQ